MSVRWLLDNAAPVIRYRVLIELLNVKESELTQNTFSEILTLPQTQKRLILFKNLNYSKTHGSDMGYLENVLPMLNDFGLYYGMDIFNHKSQTIDDVAKIVLAEEYDKLIAYPFLLRARFPIEGLLEHAIKRINTIYDFTRHMDFDIYDDIANYKGVPKSFQDRPIIKPDIASGGGKIRLPLIYDIVMMAAIYNFVSVETQVKIDNVVEYIMSPDYDVVKPMYGILYSKTQKYYAMGWDCKKPFNHNQGYSYPNLHRLLLYSNFPNIIKSAWFSNSIDYLTQYKTQNGTYDFPKEYLPESNGNWVLGARMSLAENRRKKQWSEIESTFYMLKLLSAL